MLEVLESLGLQLDSQLVERALMHRSYSYEHGGLPTNERLEFLGDSVLGIVVTEHIFLIHPTLSEGQLAKLRAAVVNSHALAGVARELDLGSAVRLGRGEEATGGRDKSSILADTMEAIIGAVFVDHGIDAARLFIHHLFDPLMARAATLGAGLDWKTSLQEICSAHSLGTPKYQVAESGPDHEKSFEATVMVGDGAFGPGFGTNKKQAEQQAAELAFAALAAGTDAGKGADPTMVAEDEDGADPIDGADRAEGTAPAGDGLAADLTRTPIKTTSDAGTSRG